MTTIHHPHLTMTKVSQWIASLHSTPKVVTVTLFYGIQVWLIFLFFSLVAKLALRALNGVRSNKYKQVDYDQLRMQAQDMKFNANKSLMKVRQCTLKNDQTKVNFELGDKCFLFSYDILNDAAKPAGFDAHLLSVVA